MADKKSYDLNFLRKTKSLYFLLLSKENFLNE